MLNAGTQTLSVTFTPTDTVNYTTATANVSLVVTPTVTWAAPSQINYGTALSATQLNATANVPGPFVYNPAAGTVLNAGTQTLSTSFTLTDTMDYTTAAATASLGVNTAATGTTLTSSVNPAVYGQSITLAATVSSTAGVPVGSVTFADGTTTLGSATLNTSGQAALTANLGTGTHKPDGRVRREREFCRE
jgi:hypothetical protein